VAATLFITENN